MAGNSDPSLRSFFDFSSGPHLRQDVDAFVAASEGQVENRAASVGHRRRLQLQHQVGAVGLGQRRLGVLLGTHHVERLQEEDTAVAFTHRVQM